MRLCLNSCFYDVDGKADNGSHTTRSAARYHVVHWVSDADDFWENVLEYLVREEVATREEAISGDGHRNSGEISFVALVISNEFQDSSDGEFGRLFCGCDALIFGYFAHSTDLQVLFYDIEWRT